MPVKLEWICTGTGHCGTGYVAQVLTALGFVCGHEHLVHSRGMVRTDFSGPGPWGYSWDKVRAESSWRAGRLLDLDLFKNAKLIHIVRAPWHVAESVAPKCGKSVTTAVAWMRMHTTCIELSPTPVERWIYRVENEADVLADIVGRRLTDDAASIPTNYNQHLKGERKLRSLDDLLLAVKDKELRAWVIEHAKKYRYA